MTYFLINNINGDTHVTAMTADMLLASLTDDDGALDMDTVMTTVPDSDPNYWHGRHLIIKGEIVRPRPLTIKYELP